MRRSTERILTTHTGSLHRPPDLEELFRKKLAGEVYDEKAFEARLRSAVAEIVQKQVSIGIDVVDDGEFSKVDFSAMRNIGWKVSKAVQFRQNPTTKSAPTNSFTQQ
jgi:methionine synthase II (cobalamin-independent)